jgi:hypothetical protein
MTETGKWFTLYDQALNVELRSGTRFLANFKYYVNPQLLISDATNPFTSGPSVLEKSNDRAFDNQFLSQCDQTMIGFVQTFSS